ncbi:MAG: DUF4157 domain-containing protein [Nostoc sp. ChiQUE02]|uniref:eCIS core domain-containing protein n=1 Tax=Nostoc sp. ChiQUE02 TaxID=3075377 RepID=UPI002AD3FDE6|nr:DUF4157 domain-containing protein [Nostoc sp. ChiQUE02]MDZ8231493.1 DUF4157 domain-containing protein [Nostoc sp. ChiQUE02]
MREQVSRKKKTTTGFSIPSLKHPTPGFGLESSAISRQAVPEIQPLHKPLTHDINLIPLRSQAKLSISQPGDIYEQEADSVAQQVMQRMAQPVNRQSIHRVALPESEEELQMKPLANSITPLVQRQEMPEEEEELQMKSLDSSTLQRQEMPEDEEELMLKERNTQNHPVQPIQAKLTIGEPGDKYEQEADHVASQVIKQINTPSAAQSTQGQSLQHQEEKPEELQAKSEITALQRQEEKKEELQAKSTLKSGEAIAGGEASTDLASAINGARGSGQPLDGGLQRSMGQAMGADFSGVRVHTDARSDQLNQSIQAKAFTTGQDVFFRQGAYEPGSRGGQELIAHELTHVVQQTGGLNRALEGGEVRISRMSEQIIQRNLNGGAAPGRQSWQYGLVYGSYNTNTNVADAHIAVGGPGVSLTQGDMLAAIQDIYQAMQACQAAGGPAGSVQMHPQGAVALKTVVELLGSALGGWWGKAKAFYLKLKREKTQVLTKGKLSDELDPVIIPEHMAFLGALIAVGGVSIQPIIPGPTTLAEFNQNMLDNTPAGVARMAQYKAALDADTTVSLRVNVDQNVLPAVIAALQ